LERTAVPGNAHEWARRRELRLAAALQRAYADALLAGDPRAAEAVIRDAIDAGLDEATIDDHVIGPSLVIVGDLWADGELSVVEEHLATSISRRVITLQREAFRVARQRSSERVLMAAAQGEQHVIGLEMAANLILRAGYDVRLLGDDVPVAELPRALQRHRPAVVGLSTASVITTANALAAIDIVREVGAGAGIVVGGRGADERWAHRGDVAVCRHVSDAVAHVDGLVKRARHN
jgi:methanogenic corrinoid protein MtbC1